MTGFSFAKIMKFKEIDDVYHKKRMQKGKPKKGEEENKLPDPKDLKDTPVNFNYYFTQKTHNKVMMNQFDNCACFHMNPEQPDKGALTLQEK